MSGATVTSARSFDVPATARWVRVEARRQGQPIKRSSLVQVDGKQAVSNRTWTAALPPVLRLGC